MTTMLPKKWSKPDRVVEVQRVNTKPICVNAKYACLKFKTNAVCCWMKLYLDKVIVTTYFLPWDYDTIATRAVWMPHKAGIPRHRHGHPREDPRRHVRHARFPEVITVASWTTRRHTRDDPREDVGVRFGVVECELNQTRYSLQTVKTTLHVCCERVNFLRTLVAHCFIGTANG